VGALGQITEFVQASRQATIEYDEELVGKKLGVFAASSSVHVLGGNFVIRLTSRAYEAQNRAPRSSTA
jgi:hypothetical protein